MRILLTADPEIPVPPLHYGGIERIVDALARGLSARGHEVGLLAHPDSACPAATRFAWPGATSGSAWDTLRNSLALRRTVRCFRPDLLHSFSRLAYLAPLRFHALPKIMSYQRHTGPRQARWGLRLGGPTLSFTGCSEFICRMGRPGGGRWDPIHNCVEPAQFTFSETVPHDAPLLFLSRVERIKGPDLAIAIARAAGRRLIIAGNHADSGPEHAFWEKEIAPHLGRDGIEYAGPVDNAAKAALLARSAALLLPIRWDEPFGIVFAEAFAAGTPVITTHRGATPEIITHGETGYFAATLHEAVSAVMALPALRRRRCREEAERRFSADSIVEAYEALYRQRLRTEGAAA
jgi:glycosyltransferase involved in cell wall biosynthesis